MADGVIRLHGLDNVVIALQDMPAGSHPAEVAASLSGANGSRYAQLFGSEPGIDPYTRSVSDV